MVRLILIIAALILASTGCSRAPEASSRGIPHPVLPAASREQPEITPDKIMRDVVGRKVQISKVTGEGPDTEWTFDADEFKQVDILERHLTQTGLTIVIFMTTRDNPKSGEDSIEVSGKLQLHYEWKGNQWTLRGIENLTFRYSVGLAI
jgi:hypothetical protein